MYDPARKWENREFRKYRTYPNLVRGENVVYNIPRAYLVTRLPVPAMDLKSTAMDLKSPSYRSKK